MGEEVRMSEYEGGGSGSEDDARVSEWEAGLPTADDLTPLSQPLIPIELASAFSISPEPCRTPVDVNRASQKTVSTLRGAGLSQGLSSNYKSFDSDDVEPMVVEAEDDDAGSDSRKSRRVGDNCAAEEADSTLRGENFATGDTSAGAAARTLKRPRLVWTPQLHKRFVDVVGHLGIKNAVPKTIMQLMNVEGLTRENVASHLQKYRLYLKRMQGLSGDSGPSSSAADQLFATTPVPQSLQHESGQSGSGQGHGQGNGNGGQFSFPMPYPPAGAMMHMPVMGMAYGHGHGHMGMPGGGGAGGYHAFESHHYNMVSYQHGGPSEK